jgi:outer membrane protein
MKTTSFIARAAAFAAVALLAREAFALNLLQSYEKAVQADPAMRAADEALAAGREKAVQGRALLLPRVTLTAGVTQVDQRSSTELPPALAGLAADGSGRVQQAALQLSQPIYDLKAGADKRQLQQQTQLAEIAWRHARQDLMQRVGEAYFGVLLARESLRVTKAEKAAVGLQRERAQARFDVGRGRITELQEAQARYDGVLAREVSTMSALAQREAKYRELTGAAADHVAALREGFVPAPPQPDRLVDWQARGEESNTRVLSRRRELDIANAEVDKHKLAARPTLDLVAAYTTRGHSGGLAGTLSSEPSRAATLGMQLRVPLYAGGALDSRLRESLARAREAGQQLDDARRDVRLQVQDAFLAVGSGVARIAALEQSVRSAQTALEATTLGRDVGTRTELDVLDAQQRVYATQLDLAQARNDYLLGRIRLAAAAGELDEADLRALNAYLER